MRFSKILFVLVIAMLSIQVMMATDYTDALATIKGESTDSRSTTMGEGVSAQKVYTKQFNDKKLRKQAKAWVKKGQWRNGFTQADPDKSVNLTDFYLQYQRNPRQWDAAFRWLATHDLQHMPKGKYPIEGTNLVASVEDSENGPLEKRQSESHYHHIDLQYCVKGTEGFGIIEHNGSRPNCDYKPDVIHYDYQRSDTKFYNSRPDRFFLFFPQDWHIAKVKTKKATDRIRVIVIKLEYYE